MFEVAGCRGVVWTRGGGGGRRPDYRLPLRMQAQGRSSGEAWERQVRGMLWRRALRDGAVARLAGRMGLAVGGMEFFFAFLGSASLGGLGTVRLVVIPLLAAGTAWVLAAGWQVRWNRDRWVQSDN